MSGAERRNRGDAVDDGARVQAAYAHCLRIAGGHYENFPVASHALPAALRAPVAAVYAFARSADDFADEGELEVAERLALLTEYGRRLDALERSEETDDPIFIALADLYRRRALPLQPLRDLLSAFSQDVTRRRYRDEADLLDYCRRSADPVERLLRTLFGHTTPRDIAQSDAVCTALQRSISCGTSGRTIARTTASTSRQTKWPGMASENHFSARRTDGAMLALIALQSARARRLLDHGAPLAAPARRIGLELRMVIRRRPHPPSPTSARMFSAARACSAATGRHPLAGRQPTVRRKTPASTTNPAQQFSFGRNPR